MTFKFTFETDNLELVAKIQQLVASHVGGGGAQTPVADTQQAAAYTPATQTAVNTAQQTAVYTPPAETVAAAQTQQAATLPVPSEADLYAALQAYGQAHGMPGVKAVFELYKAPTLNAKQVPPEILAQIYAHISTNRPPNG